ncbi:aldo/keto reductase [Streptomyces sp. NBC_00391]|uniref:aldo/keto reductase n=1 Tax=Streptomyces sp. NBC_00391 TaxID=2903647 RepID=UPI002E1F8B70
MVGRALRTYARREDIALATKVFHPMRQGPGGGGLSRKAILEQVGASLARLDTDYTDYTDLYQIHRFDPETRVLHDVVKAGKVRYLGASSMLDGVDRVCITHPDQTQPNAALEPARRRAGHPAMGGQRTSRARSNPAVDEQGRPLFLDTRDGTVIEAPRRHDPHPAGRGDLRDRVAGEGLGGGVRCPAQQHPPSDGPAAGPEPTRRVPSPASRPWPRSARSAAHWRTRRSGTGSCS